MELNLLWQINSKSRRNYLQNNRLGCNKYVWKRWIRPVYSLYHSMGVFWLRKCLNQDWVLSGCRGKHIIVNITTKSLARSFFKFVVAVSSEQNLNMRVHAWHLKFLRAWESSIRCKVHASFVCGLERSNFVQVFHLLLSYEKSHFHYHLVCSFGHVTSRLKCDKKHQASKVLPMVA
jgi:hypothetical protein